MTKSTTAQHLGPWMVTDGSGDRHLTDFSTTRTGNGKATWSSDPADAPLVFASKSVALEVAFRSSRTARVIPTTRTEEEELVEASRYNVAEVAAPSWHRRPR